MKKEKKSNYLRTALALIMLLSLVIAFVSCGGAPEPAPQPEPKEEPVKEEKSTGGMDIPSWYLNPPVVEDAFYGVGSAKMSKLDSSRKMAIARAREDIAFQINATVKAAITDYAQEAGADGESQTINFVETISRQLTETTLTNTKTEKIEVDSEERVYAMVSYNVNEFKESAAKEFQRNEDAAFAEFKAQEALKKLNHELENNPPKAGESPASKEK
jgi:adenylate kinase family enzyme